MIKKSLILLVIVLVISIAITIEPAYAVNQIKQLIKMTGTYPVDVSFFDVTISPAIENINKTIVFVDFGHSERNDNADTARSWKLINSTTLRFFGDGETATGNNAVKFRIKIMEFNSTSDLLVQRDELILTAGATEQIFNQTFATAINMSNSFILPSGVNYNSTDITIGSEEFAQIYLRDTTSWSYFVADTPNTGNTTVRVQIIDWNDNAINVQRDSTTFNSTDTTFSVSPPTAIDADTSLLLVTYSSNNGLAQQPKEESFSAILNTATNNIDFERQTAGSTLDLRWEIIDFPPTFPIRHETNTNAGTLQNFLLTPALTNFTETVAIGTVHTYFGDGNTKSGCGFNGCWEELMHTQILTSNTNLAIERGAGGGSHQWVSQIFDVGEFFTPTVGQIFNQTVTDVVTAIDLSQSKNVTKLTSDLAGTADTVSTGVIFVVNLNDTGTATDVVTINVTKLAQDTVSVGDDPSFVISKLIEDIVSINDTVNIASIFGVEVLDTVTANDLVIFNITKQFSDVIAQIDDPNLNTTKVFIDITSVVDTTITSTDTGVNQTDTTIVLDNVTIDLTKLIQDVATTSDNVVVGQLIDLLIDDTVIIDDPSVILRFQTTGGNPPISSGGGGGVPTLQRLVGLSIQSELFFVGETQTVTGLSLFQPVTVPTINPIPSDFIIQTFGREDNIVSIVNIQTDQQFTSWFQFSRLPQTLQFETEIDRDRSFTDPARFTNIALNSYVLTIPTQSCANLDPISSIPCIDPILYEIPITFSFSKGGVIFNERHFVTVDASTPLVCDPICQLVEFLTENYWWLAGIVIVFMMLYFLGGKVIRAGGIKTVRRIDKKAFTSFEAKPKRKFKRGKG